MASIIAGNRSRGTSMIVAGTGERSTSAWIADSNEVATPRPAVVHQETDTFITTYTAIDPPRAAGGPAGAALTLDGFFGWPLEAVAS